MNVIKTKATIEEYDRYLDFINYVFGMNGFDSSFPKLLPVLYKNRYKAWENAHIVKEDDEIKAAVGSFPFTINVKGDKFKVAGIGNVAVHPSCRSKGYMKDTMNRALAEMKQEGVDFTVLGGLRQRYNYFSYEISGQAFTYTVSTTNIRQIFGKDKKSSLTLKLLCEDNISQLEAVHTLMKQRSLYVEREQDVIFDRMLTWEATAYVAYDKEKFVGYVVLSKDRKKVHEFAVNTQEYIDDCILAALELSGNEQLSFTFAPFDSQYNQRFADVAETCSIVHAASFCVLNYKKVIQVLLKLKAGYQPLCDGDFTMLIHGMAGDEKLSITVAGQEVSVTDTDKPEMIELSHLEAMQLLFCIISPARSHIPAIPASWLPLPIYNYDLDNV